MKTTPEIEIDDQRGKMSLRSGKLYRQKNKKQRRTRKKIYLPLLPFFKQSKKQTLKYGNDYNAYKMNF